MSYFPSADSTASSATPSSTPRSLEIPKDGSLVAKACQIFARTQGFKADNHLLWRDRYQGSTNYHDGILQTDLTQPVMWSEDRFGRKSFSMKYHSGGAETALVTVFQRFPHSNNVLGFASCDGFGSSGCSLENLLRQASARSEDEFLQSFETFLEGKPVKEYPGQKDLTLGNRPATVSWGEYLTSWLSPILPWRK